MIRVFSHNSGSVSEMNQVQKESVAEEINEMCCADCKTTKTPLWRVGPAGPKSLCNACGIRYRKKRNSSMGLNRGPEKRKDKTATTTAAATPITTSTSTTSSSYKTSGCGGGGGKGGNLSENLRVKLMALGKEVVMLQRQRSPKKRQRMGRNLGEEEEQAAVLLMALSCGSVFG